MFELFNYKIIYLEIILENNLKDEDMVANMNINEIFKKFDED